MHFIDCSPPYYRNTSIGIGENSILTMIFSSDITISRIKTSLFAEVWKEVMDGIQAESYTSDRDMLTGHVSRRYVNRGERKEYLMHLSGQFKVLIEWVAQRQQQALPCSSSNLFLHSIIHLLFKPFYFLCKMQKPIQQINQHL